MYSSETYPIKAEEELLDKLGSRLVGNDEIAIIGGHFMLFFDKKANMLKPIIVQDLRDARQINFAEYYAGNFPLRSFLYSVSLYSKLKRDNKKSGIVLLVNDHKFQSTSFQLGIAEFINNKGGTLRQGFYKRDSLPESYKSILIENQILESEILIRNNDLKRLRGDLLPKESIFFSEQKLRNRFDKHNKRQLISDGIIRQEISGNNVELYFESPNHENDFCLTEEGVCACSAEVIELISNLLSRNISEIVFFVPNECISSVDNGILASLNINQKSANVITISNFGGIGFEEKEDNPFVITDHKYE